MPWHQQDSRHWYNDSDKHIIWDRDDQTLSTEIWEKGEGVKMVVVPFEVVKSLLEQNGCVLIQDKEFADVGRIMAVQFEADQTMQLEAMEEELQGVQFTFERALEVVETDSRELLEAKAEIKRLQLELDRANLSKVRLMDEAHAGMVKLRQEIAALKEKEYKRGYAKEYGKRKRAERKRLKDEAKSNKDGGVGTS